MPPSTTSPQVDFSSLPVPPRLTPSPPPSLPTTTPPSSPDLPPIAPLRKSIYPHPKKQTWHVNVTPYSPHWPTQFATIKSHLETLFTTATNPPVPYISIEHIGSTAIPSLAAKPNIDILVTFASTEHLNAAVNALNWENPKSPPYTRYTQCPNGGGIPGRESFKLYLPEWNAWYARTPERSVYLIADVAANEAGRVQIRCYRTVRDVLRDTARNGDLLEEYGRAKIELSGETFRDPLEYSARKDEVVRKILVRGGWTPEEVDRKEEITRRVYEVSGDDEDAY